MMAHSTPVMMAHNISLLDDPQVDFFIHIDAKSPLQEFQHLRWLPQYSKVVFVPRVRVNWGGYSVIEAELQLFKAAVSGGYDYFHLISESDLLVVSKKSFLSRFLEKERYFIEIRPLVGWRETLRAQQFYPWQEHPWFGKDPVGGKLSKGLALLQKCVGIKRKQSQTYYKGASWCSLGSGFVRYLTAAKTMAAIQQACHWGSCHDELYKQTLFVPWLAQHQQAYWVNDHLRYIDWQQGGPSPKALTEQDYPTIKEADVLFCRKVLPDSTLLGLIKEGCWD